MRILSQDGMQIQDLPYEKTRVYIEKDGITVKGLFDGIIFDLAKYSTVEKARKAMEMLHHMYTYGEEVELPEIDEKQFAEDDDIGLSNAIFYNKNRFFRVSKKYFQFPQDNEVEV